jgi:hypothetical protein
MAYIAVAALGVGRAQVPERAVPVVVAQVGLRQIALDLALALHDALVAAVPRRLLASWSCSCIGPAPTASRLSRRRDAANSRLPGRLGLRPGGAPSSGWVSVILWRWSSAAAIRRL